MSALRLLIILIAVGCQKTPETKCERFADVKKRCHASPADVERFGDALLTEGERLCHDVEAVADDHEDAFTRDEVRCAERFLACKDFYECSSREVVETMHIKSGLRLLDELTKPTQDPRSEEDVPCWGYQELLADLQKSARPLAGSLVRRIGRLCDRDAWLTSAQRVAQELSRRRERPDERRPGTDPDWRLCDEARSRLDRIAEAYRADAEVAALGKRLDELCAGLP